jgi:hypothetical protein
MTAWRATFLVAAVSLTVLGAMAGGAAAATPCPVSNTAAQATDLTVDQTCKIGTGTHFYRDVNIVAGGTLWFQDEPDVHFWARSIIIENNGRLLAGTDENGNLIVKGVDKDGRLLAGSSPIGTGGGVVTIHLWGQQPATPTTPVTGARCLSGGKDADPPCGIDKAVWDSDKMPHEKVNLPGGVSDYFFKYDPLPRDDGDQRAYFGTKVLAVSYGGTLKLFGAKGAVFGDVAATSSGTSWARLEGTVGKTAKTLVLDREVDWLSKDGVKNQVVVTTTDYLPGHSELLEIQAVRSDRKTVDVANIAPQCSDGAGGLCWIHNGTAYDLAKRNVPDRLGLDFTKVETRAAVALLTRSIRIVSGGENAGDPFPAESTGYYFGGHTVVRQGFKDFEVQGVEFYQLGQGGRLAHYPVHFHLARKTSPDAAKPRVFLKDSSIHDSMTRWVTLHGTQDVLLARNVGYRSIGHGYYLEDGTEINNRFHSNIGIYARAAVLVVEADGKEVAQRDNLRKVPGILAAAFNPSATDNVPFYTDYNRPSVFWIMNGWNDFEGNMAAGAGTCGACYWLVPGAISGHSADPHVIDTWESYASLQRADKGMQSTTPLKTFRSNFCSSAMFSFNTVGNSGTCNGLGQSLTGDVYFKGIANPLAATVPFPAPALNAQNYPNYYPKVDQGGGRFATKCDKSTPGAKSTGPNPDDVDCSGVAKCSSGNSATNCEMTVLDRYTSAFHWAETNFGAIWLRPQWYVVLNSALSDVQAGGLGFVSGGDYTKSSSPEGNLMLVRKSVFIGNTQDNAANPLASNAGPFVSGGLTCDSKPSTINYCLSKAEGITMQLVSFAQFQRLFTIYDGPAHQDSNAYLDITQTAVTKCAKGQGNCQDSPSMYGRTAGVLWDKQADGGTGACVLPNAAIAWKQPNGFYYPPSFHSRNLYFHNVDIRHYVVEPLFVPGTREQDDDAVREAYCTFVLSPYFGMFGASFSAVDRQTILNDDDGSLTGFRDTVSVNEDRFFTAPVETPECRSGNLNLLSTTSPRTASVTGTAKTSPYEYVTTAVYPGCASSGCGGTVCTVQSAGTADCCKLTGDPATCTQTVAYLQPCDGGQQCMSLWSNDCTNQSCFGVPLYRQLVTAAEKAEIDKDKSDLSKRPSIQMAAMAIYQRSNLTANNGVYYIDTTPSLEQQKAVRPANSPIRNLNVFAKGPNPYYVYQIFAKPHTRITYQLYVGPSFDKNDLSQLWAIQTTLGNPIAFAKLSAWPASWERKYGTADGLPDGVLQVTMDMQEFAQAFADALPGACRPDSYCKWDAAWTKTSNKCRCASTDPVSLAECQQNDDAVCAWAVADVDCPKGGCLGFAVKLTDGFQTGQRTPPDVSLFFPRTGHPQAGLEWSVALEEVAPGLAGAECQPASAGISGFGGTAQNVGSGGGVGELTLSGTFSPSTNPAFNLGNAHNVTLNLLMHELPPTADELVVGYPKDGAVVLPLPINLARIPGQGAIFKTVEGIAPAAQLTIDNSTAPYKFTLRVNRIDIHTADECPKTSPIELVTSFNIYGVAEPVDVHITGKWSCRDTTKPYRYQVIN